MKYFDVEDPEIRICFFKTVMLSKIKEKDINRVGIEEEKLLAGPGLKPGTTVFLVRSSTTEPSRPIFMVFISQLLHSTCI